MIKDALKYLEPNAVIPIDMATTIMLVNALKEALAQRTEQEPVAWAMDYDIESVLSGFSTSLMGTAMRIESAFPKHRVKLLYTTPPQRKPLTDEEMKKIWYALLNIMGWYSFQEIARAIEAAHGIKENT
jgi:hypothetical protein